MKLILKQKLIFIGIAVGAIGGYLYYHFVGCASGSCAITANPWISMLYGAFMGGFLFNLFNKQKSNKNA